MDETFIIGGAIKVSPLLEEANSDVISKGLDVYFPSGVWVDINNPESIIDTRETGGATKTLPLTGPTVFSHMKQGSLIPF